MGKSGAEGSSRNTESGAPEGDSADLSCGINKEEIKQNIQKTHADVHKAWERHISAAPENAGIHGAGHIKRKEGSHDAEICPCIRPDFRVCTEKSRKKTAERNNNKRETDPKQKIKQDSLAQHVPAVLFPPGTQILGHLNGKTHGDGTHNTV